jgi:hypothetical protein
MITRDLSLVASQLYRMAVTRPWTRHVPLAGMLTACRYIIHLFRSRLPGLQPPLHGKDRKQSNKRSVYVLVRSNKSRYRSVPHRATFVWIRHTGQLHLHVHVAKTHADTICTEPRSKEEKKRREKQETSKSDPVLHISTS